MHFSLKHCIFIFLSLILVNGIALGQNSIADSLNAEAYNLLYSNTEKSMELSENTIHLLHANSLDTNQALIEAWINYGNGLYLQKKYSEAIDTLSNALVYINKMEPIELVSRLLNLYSHSHKELRNDTVSLLSYYQEIWQKKDTIAINRTATSLNEMGNYYLIQGNLDRALFYYQKYLSWVQRGTDSILIADAYHHIGTVYQNLMAPKQALNFYHKALLLKQKYATKNDLAKTVNNIGAVYLITHQYDSAIYFMKKANAIFREVNNLLDLSKNLTNLGIVYDQKKDFSQALKYYNESYEIAIKLNNDNELAINLLNFGGFYYTNGNLTKALEYFKKAEIHANKTSNLFLKSRLMYGESVIYELLNQPNQALQKLKVHVVLQDSILSENTTKQIAEMGAKYELERKNQEITSLNKDAEIKELKLKQNKTQTRLLLSILFGILITLSLVVYLFRQRGRLNKALKEHNAIVQEQNEELNQINDELKSINNQLILSEEKLQISNRTKEKLLSIIAHDIRNPLLAAKSFIHLVKLNAQTYSKEDIKTHAGLLESSVHSIGELLNNLLEWGRTQQNKAQVQIESFELNQLIEKNLKLVDNWLLQKDLKAIFEYKHEIMLETDKNMLDFIFRNLLNNAIKFSHPQNNITIIISEEARGVLSISVTDYGLGMNQETLTKVFSSTDGFSSTGTQNEKGTGLGLQLCKQFAVLLKGELRVESEINKGSTFTLVIPKTLQN